MEYCQWDPMEPRRLHWIWCLPLVTQAISPAPNASLRIFIALQTDSTLPTVSVSQFSRPVSSCEHVLWESKHYKADQNYCCKKSALKTSDTPRELQLSFVVATYLLWHCQVETSRTACFLWRWWGIMCTLQVLSKRLTAQHLEQKKRLCTNPDRKQQQNICLSLSRYLLSKDSCSSALDEMSSKWFKQTDNTLIFQTSRRRDCVRVR
jgi:hypothetical protein